MTNQSKAQSDESAKARNMLDKALDLLGEVGSIPAGQQAAELARDCDVPLSTAYRLLGSLVQRGYLELDKKTRQYRIGIGIFTLAQFVAQARGLTGVARPILEELAETTGEATLMAVRDGTHQLYVHYVQGPHSVAVIGRPGTLGPLHCTAQGKILVAMATAETREELIQTLELEQYGPNCITDRALFRAEIENIRQRGWAIADEEHQAGIRAVAAPVLRAGGDSARAAISIAAPTFRTDRDTLTRWVPELNRAATRIATLMPID
jgi:DNA-binding IclR family transcriptional regulator